MKTAVYILNGEDVVVVGVVVQEVVV